LDQILSIFADPTNTGGSLSEASPLPFDTGHARLLTPATRPNSRRADSHQAFLKAAVLRRSAAGPW
jgi:hypothetical protein